MKTILIPVDFSATARNSAIYAAGLARYVNANKLVLFNAYSVPLATEMSWAVLQTEELKHSSEEGLKEFAAMLSGIIGPEISIETRPEFGFLAERIESVSNEVNADLIVMGITGGGKLEEVLIGSNTTHVINHTHVPVLIVPPEATWKPVRTIGWACDYKDVLKTTPADVIMKMIDEFHAKLIVVHNNTDPKAFDPELFNNNVMVSEMFHKLTPEFVMVSNDHLSDAINEFTEKYNVDMLLAVPKKQSWIDSIFHRSSTKMLAFHSHVPLLCIQGLKPLPPVH